MAKLRTADKVKVLRGVYREMCGGEDFRMVDWSIQNDHIHNDVEVTDEQALSRGMKSFGVRVARGINRLMGRTGRVIADRPLAVGGGHSARVTQER